MSVFRCKIGFHKWRKVRDGVRECTLPFCYKRQVLKNGVWVPDEEVITGFISDGREPWYAWKTDVEYWRENKKNDS